MLNQQELAFCLICGIVVWATPGGDWRSGFPVKKNNNKLKEGSKLTLWVEKPVKGSAVFPVMEPNPIQRAIVRL